jgi:hypothetical protein
MQCLFKLPYHFKIDLIFANAWFNISPGASSIKVKPRFFKSIILICWHIITPFVLRFGLSKATSKTWPRTRLVIGAARAKETILLNRDGERIMAGLLPFCSCPAAGSKLVQTISPRFGIYDFTRLLYPLVFRTSIFCFPPSTALV